MLVGCYLKACVYMHRHTRKQLYEHKTHKVGQTQARQMADNTVKAFCVVAANQCGPVPHRKKMYY